MAMTYKKRGYVELTIPELGTTYNFDVVDVTVKGVPTDDGSTKFEILIPDGFKYLNGIAIKLAAEPNTEVADVSATFDEGAKLLTVVAAKTSDLAINTAYVMEFNLQEA